MLLLTLALFSQPAEPAVFPVEEINSPRDLWMAMRWYGLPTPPRNARLITLDKDEGPPENCYFGWVLSSGSGSTPSIVMRIDGTSYYEHRKSILDQPAVTIEQFERGKAYYSAWRAMALHCWLGGDYNLAQKALDTAQNQIQSPRIMGGFQSLEREAWHHWHRQVFQRNANREQALLYLHRIARETHNTSR